MRPQDGFAQQPEGADRQHQEHGAAGEGFEEGHARETPAAMTAADVRVTLRLSRPAAETSVDQETKFALERLEKQNVTLIRHVTTLAKEATAAQMRGKYTVLVATALLHLANVPGEQTSEWLEAMSTDDTERMMTATNAITDVLTLLCAQPRGSS